MLIKKSIIAPKLKKLKSFIPAKGSISAAQGILLQNNMLIANAFELAVSSPLGADTSETFVIPPSAIDFIINLPDGDVTIEECKSKIIIKSGKASASFAAPSASDFPTKEIFSVEGNAAEISCDAEEIMSEISRVLFACDTGNGNPIFNAVLFQGDGTHLNVVASDGRRIAWNKLRHYANINAADYANINAAVNKSSLQKILALDLSGPIDIYTFNNSRIVFRTADYSVYANTVQGNPLDYKKLFSKGKNGYETLKIKSLPFLECLKRSVICNSSGLRASPVVLEIDGTFCKVNLKSDSSEFSENVMLLNEKLNGGVQIGLNASFLIEAIKAAKADIIEFSVKDALSLIKISTGALEQVILPVRVRGA